MGYKNLIELVLSPRLSPINTTSRLRRSIFLRFPVDSVYLRCGDCEDKSFLFASLVEEMGYDAVCLVFDDHLAVGVASADAHGTYYDKFGSQYYYCETTAVGWEMGVIPDSYGASTIVQVE